MKLYMHPFSQHCRRVLMLCRELGLKIDRIVVALDRGEHKTEDFLRLSRTGLIPVLADGDLRLAESHAIMRYLSAVSGDRAFYPADVKARAVVDMWLDWNHTRLNPPIQTIAIQQIVMKDKADQSIIASAHTQAQDALAILDRALNSRDSIGGAVTLADLSIASTLALYELVGGSPSHHSAVSAWFEGLKRRPSFHETAPRMA
ncbi:glutathione S-transferase family protein [Dongia deserti]|uniref:glutathione S-transferase family protein n=1 Tax=Dongia deserti TaxID=2268030 RepID=UPI0013C50CD5|nr:glutathione S-transferase family protein [Dongia deserti]